MANKEQAQLEFTALSMALDRLQASGTLSDKLEQAVREAAYLVREVHQLACAGGNATVEDINTRLRERVLNPAEFARKRDAERGA